MTTCNDNWGLDVTIDSATTWKKVEVKFDDPMFKQSGWGPAVAFDKKLLKGLQFEIQPGDFDFWVDEIMFLKSGSSSTSDGGTKADAGTSDGGAKADAGTKG
jgi:hypothetical protein